MRDASRERTFCDSRLSGVACALWVLASLALASCGGKSGSTGDTPEPAPAHVKAEAAGNETEAIELAKTEFLKSGGGLNAADCRVSGVKASTVQHEPVWIVTLKHTGLAGSGNSLEVIVNKRTGKAYLSPKK
jgi:hypothetical protein